MMGRDELDADQLSSMREAFALFDTDGDGRISPADLGVIMRSLGSNPTQSQLRHIQERESLTAPIGFERFLELMSKYMKPEDFESELRDAFRVLDKDCTGFVEVADLRHILTSIGERLEAEEFDDWIQELDVGPDGRFRYDEFIAQIVAK